jgi:hypothetical protein
MPMGDSLRTRHGVIRSARDLWPYLSISSRATLMGKSEAKR